MGFWDAFSGQGSKKAAVLANILGTQNQQQAAVALTQGKQEGIGYIDGAQGPQIDALGGARTASIGDIESFYGKARDQFTPYIADGRRADGVYQDSLGLNGQEGYDRSLATYRESPGVRFAIKEATDQAERAKSAIGQLGSGNTVQEVSERAMHLKDGDIGGWQDRLDGVGRRGYDASG